jgi:general secretion pathway protein J
MCSLLRMCLPKNRGFTLVEVMIAAGILAVIMSIVYSSFSGSLKTMAIGEERGDAYRKGRLILSRMVQEISCAYLPQTQELPDIKYAFIGEDKEEDGIPRDSLYFISTIAPIEGVSAGLKEVGFYLTPDSQTGELTLVMREDPTPDDQSDEGGRRYVLGSTIFGLDFEYYDENGREWKRWETTSSTFGYKLPKVVKISLLFKDERGEAIAITTKTRVLIVGE